MIATGCYYNTPYYISPYRTCHCTWTVCQCQRAYNWPQTTWITIETTPKSKSNKMRMEGLRLRAESRLQPKKKYSAPTVRPSIQALSMRIR